MGLGRVVVVPLASPATAPWLGRLAAMLARPDEGTVVAVSVVTPGRTDAAVQETKQAVELAASAARDLGVRARAEVVHGQRVPTAVLDAVDVHDASLVVMGWQGESTSHNVFGELIDSIMGRSRVPLAVVRPAADEFGRVLLPLGDDHLGDSARRGVDLAVELADRLREATKSTLLVVRGGEGDQPLPGALHGRATPTVRAEADIPHALGHISRTGDIVVTPVAPTADGLRNATTHIAWATPECWQLVAIDVGPAQPVDVVSAVKDAGMLVEPRPEQEDDVPHIVEVAMTVPADVEDAWARIATAVRLVGSVLSHQEKDAEDGQRLILGNVEVRATSAAAALSAIMVELDDARWQIGATGLNYRLITADVEDAPDAS